MHVVEAVLLSWVNLEAVTALKLHVENHQGSCL